MGDSAENSRDLGLTVIEPPHSILWRRLDQPGHESAWIDGRDDGWSLSGTAVFGYDGTPCRLDYRVICAADWRTTGANVTGRFGDRGIELRVVVSEGGEWRLNGSECPAVRGCVDIDLGFSPATNLLPIRRLDLAVGESADVVAAWLPFPDLAFEPLPQVYRRETVSTYRYESNGGAFVRVLEVDEVGFVTRYPGLWQVEPTLVTP